MKTFDRVRSTLNNEETDRPPIFDNIRNDSVIEYFSDQELTVENGKDIYIKGIDNFLDCTKQFLRFPQKERIEKENSFAFAYSANLPPEVLKDIEFEVEYKRWSTWVYDRSKYNFNNVVKKAEKVINSYNGWNDWNKRELNNIIKDFNNKKTWFKNTEIFACVSEVGLGTTYDFIGGLEKFSYLFQDDYYTLMKLFDTFYQMNLDKVKNIPDGFEPVAVFVPEDIAQKNGLIFNPAFLRNEFFPRLKKIVDCYHDKHLKVIFHSDGNLWEIMDDLIDCGIDCLNPVETMAGMDIKRIKERYPHLILLGGIDCSQLLPFGSIEEIKKVTRDTINDASKGYFPGSTSEIHNKISLDRYLAFYEEVIINKS